VKCSEFSFPPAFQLFILVKCDELSSRNKKGEEKNLFVEAYGNGRRIEGIKKSLCIANFLFLFHFFPFKICGGNKFFHSKESMKGKAEIYLL
jgi:hypothetical protein